MFRFFFLALISALVVVNDARAELIWERDLRVISAEPGAGTVLAKFAFQNAGARAVIITSVKTSCGCTGTSLAKKTWAPGERGELQARYFAGERKGVYGVEIEVGTDDAKTPKRLHLRAVMAAGAELKPTLAFWKADEELSAKRLVLKMPPDAQAEATSSNPDVQVQIVGRSEIVVMPKARGLKATLEIAVTVPGEKVRVLKAFVRS